MAVSAMLAALRPDRLAVVGSLAVRPVVHRGANGIPFPVSSEPIFGLSVFAGPRRTKSVFHSSTNIHGFLDLPTGLTLVATLPSPPKEVSRLPFALYRARAKLSHEHAPGAPKID